ncbi:MAG: HPr family phosphocarrier protein [Candidatus Sumerlaeia bacterium]|nr:HPr family phosphocarrier protein [Candidatus Sumerlaeia bacterium]
MAERKTNARRTIRIMNPLGLHARPSSLVVQTASYFPDCDVSLTDGRQKVNAKSIMGVLGLAAAAGTELVVETKGRNAELALEAVCRMIAEMEKFEQYETREETQDAWRKLIKEITSKG